jgi:ferredoxin-NADP reductase
MDDRLTLTVTAKTTVADDVTGLTLTHPAGRRLPDWTPGAHIDLVLPNGETRQYSLCGDRWDPGTYRVAVQREPDGRGGSQYVHDVLRPGDTVGVGGPRNNFPLVPSQRYRFVAGGIGITPLLPMIHQADLLGADWNCSTAGAAGPRWRSSTTSPPTGTGSASGPGRVRPAGPGRVPRPAGAPDRNEPAAAHRS